MAWSRAKTWAGDQKNFEGLMAYRHLDSVGFLASVRNSVAKQEFFRSRPKAIQKDLAGRVLGRISASVESRQQAARAEANRALLHVDDVLRVGDLNLSWDDDSLSNWAEARADKCGKIVSDDDHSIHVLRWMVNGYGLQWPAFDLFGDAAAVARVCSSKWWRRKARVLKVRAIDQLARHFRMVHAKAQPYASNEAVKLRRLQARRNRMTLEGFEAINQEGDAYTLAELSDLSVSNPTNRRHELMVRMRGFEQIAEQFGHVGLFVTMSAPSKFHPMRQVKNARGRLVRVEENPKYNGATPRDAQDWLNKTWSLVRSALDRLEIRCYGFRVVEPHSDGCPHWHQLLFFSAENIESVKTVFKNYSLRTDASEKGAAEYRLKIVLIDREKGSAAGYIAKYISKSIDGSHVDDDLIGNSGSDAAERICAWASSWGIRQFQQIGGASVTVWRELRRLADGEGIVEQMREAADAANWAAYLLLQSGGMPFVKRDLQAVRAAYWLEHDADTGEVIDESVNKYGEESKGKLFGVVTAAGEYFLTRFYRWTIQRVGEAAKAVKKALPVCNLSADELLDLLRGDGLGSTA
ncbi:MAG: replication endonuclease [Cellvibrio sp.]|uniref:replication endonuclease n=1 Tax=Cellvibrio sp. TaxID=1965322 RepID=UPI0031AC4535